eukprot:TRINITY_DN7357_c0_g1_i1.p1 TRINITY_DN7357_c0_g1~~TRINITY_DN7357_c0_g1_i1.p1  ORF type:complete len:497 (+),score=183.00 TRINITY_DN7357_c0_g1_i1:224-1492(+)
MSAFSFLGPELVTKDGNKPTADVLAGKEYVLLYFSASWCPPCQRFTPLLENFYAAHGSKLNFEVVFVSGDRDEKSMKEYYAKMPWAAIPFGASERQQCSGKYCGDGIPDLAIFDKMGNVVKQGAVQNVMGDREAKNFPWPPPTWAQCIPATLTKKDGSTVSKDTLAGKTIGVYCSAHWCPPCREFTPELAKFYSEYKKTNPDFEIIFVSSDKSEDEMKSYFTESHGDYLAMDYNCLEREKMKELIDAPGIPTFAVFSPEGKLINKAGRERVDAGVADVKENGWGPPALGNLATGTKAAGLDLNSAMSVIVNVEGCDDDEQNHVEQALLATANEYIANGNGTPEVIFFISKQSSGISSRIAQLTKSAGSARCGAPGNDPLMLCLNLSENGAFYESAETDITVDNVKAFIASVQSKAAKRLQLG